MAKPSVSFAIDIGPPSHKRATRRRRVSSPSAAKSGAEPVNSTRVRALAVLGKILLNQLDLDGPAAFVRCESRGAALERDVVEPGLGDGQLDGAVHLFELEQDRSEERRVG